MARESEALALERWAKLRVLQEHYPTFGKFLEDGMRFLGFDTTELQHDIGDFLQMDAPAIMAQAQRSQAKTTIAALYAVWCIIHSPAIRVLIISAGGTQANEISTLIVRFILNNPTLDCLVPDQNAGDRTSVEAFDVHHSLKGLDKSPTVACVGITANMQGKRADLLIADDVESTKNGLTAVQREQLRHLTLDFASICVGRPELGIKAKIVWLGTPQTIDSIYNGLPGRGVVVRIWPGRYPTPEQRAHYGDCLAPYIADRLDRDPSLATGGGIDGKQGKPTDPKLLGEEKLQFKERDQGAAYFQLQHMLNTRLTDAQRFPLKTTDLIVMRLSTSRVVPVSIAPSFMGQHQQTITSCGLTWKVGTPASVSQETVLVPQLIMYIDPAGGGANADETGYSVTGMVNGNVFLFDAGGVPGGYAIGNMKRLAQVAKLWQVSMVVIEKNFGYGAFREVFTPILQQFHKCAVEDDMVHGQKERRIIGTLEPVMGRGALIVNEAIVTTDDEQARVHGAQKMATYSLFHQMARVTRDVGALVHDDRLDAVEGGVRYWQTLIAQDQEKVLERLRKEQFKKLTANPLGHPITKSIEDFKRRARSVLQRRLR